MTAESEIVIVDECEAAPAPATAATCLLVTIITPTYNRADMLTETVVSVLEQDYPFIEYIILDDGSKDNTEQIVERFKDRVTYLYHDNIGETATVNKGLSRAKGEIVCVVNSDDPFFTKDAVSVAVQCLVDNPDALMAYPDWVSIDEKGTVIHEETLPQYTLENMIESAHVSVGPGIFIRKSCIEKIGLRNPDVRYVGDLDYSFRIAAAGRIVHIPRFLATHRVHAGAQSSFAKGRCMAAEVASLGERFIDHPSLPEYIRKKRNRLMAKWYFISIYFAGSDIHAVFYYLGKAASYSLLTTIRMSLLSSFRLILKPFKRRKSC